MSAWSSKKPPDVIAAFLADVRERYSGTGELDRDQVAEVITRLRCAGLGALTVPTAAGGGGAGLPVLFEFLVDLGAIDPNISHAIGNHYNFVDSLRTHADSQLIDGLHQQVVEGSLFTVCAAEGGAAAGAAAPATVAVARPDGGFTLNGTKMYSTGSIFADMLAVRAATGAGEPRTVIVASAARGVSVRDDWEAFGQRHTGSGTVTFDDVEVAGESVADFTIPGVGLLPYRGGFTQLVLLASAAGIAERIHSDTVSMIRRRGRNFDHGVAEKPADDPIVQSIVGEIGSIAWVSRLAVRAAAEPFAARPDPRIDLDAYVDAAHIASAHICRAKSIIDRLTLSAANRLFDAGSASSVAVSKQLDRHWRNLRTLSSHNPKEYRERALGNYELNNEALPVNGFF